QITRVFDYGALYSPVVIVFVFAGEAEQGASPGNFCGIIEKPGLIAPPDATDLPLLPLKENKTGDLLCWIRNRCQPGGDGRGSGPGSRRQGRQPPPGPKRPGGGRPRAGGFRAPDSGRGSAESSIRS